ncbi:unnamed protein product, partial [Polarella glacialis]
MRLTTQQPFQGLEIKGRVLTDLLHMQLTAAQRLCRRWYLLPTLRIAWPLRARFHCLLWGGRATSRFQPKRSTLKTHTSLHVQWRDTLAT